MDINEIINDLGRVDARENNKRLTVRINETQADTLAILSEMSGRAVTNIAERIVRISLDEAALVVGLYAIAEKGR